MKLNGLEKIFKTDKRGFIIDFNQVNGFKNTPLIVSFYYNKTENLNLTNDQLNFLIKKSDLKHINKLGWSPLMYALTCNDEENLNLTLDQFEYMINHSDLNLIYNSEIKEISQELKNIQAEINNKNILNKINNKEVIKKIKI